MKRLQVSIAAIAALAIVGGLMNLRELTAQQPACLHGQNETPEELGRRHRAIGLTRHINTLEAEASQRTSAYLPLALLGVTEAYPPGFTTELVTDGASYAFSVKDTLDPCRFGYFSDQNGVIYVGQVSR